MPEPIRAEKKYCIECGKPIPTDSVYCTECGKTQRAQEMDPKLAQVLFNGGLALQRSGRNEEAIKACDKALEIDPKYAQAGNSRGIALSELGRKEEAIKSYDKALEINPKLAQAQSNREVALRDLGRSRAPQLVGNMQNIGGVQPASKLGVIGDKKRRAHELVPTKENPVRRVARLVLLFFGLVGVMTCLDLMQQGSTFSEAIYAGSGRALIIFAVIWIFTFGCLGLWYKTRPGTARNAATPPRTQFVQAVQAGPRSTVDEPAHVQSQQTSLRTCQKHHFVMAYDNQTHRYFCPGCDKDNEVKSPREKW